MHPFLKKIIFWGWHNRKEIVKYLIVGFSAFAIDYALFAIMHKYFGLWYITASIISQAVTLTYIYVLNRTWSFRSQGSKRKQVKRFAFLQAWNNVFQIGALWITVEVIGLMPLLAKIIVVAIIVSWNFLLYKYFVYNH